MTTVVALNAHPDDEALLTGGTLASLAARGHRVVLVTATDGGAGLAPTELLDGLAATRAAELEASAAALGAARVVPLGYADSGHRGEVPPDPEGTRRFVRVPVAEAAERVAQVVREEGAPVLLGYDRNGGYHHRDHVHVHHVARAAARLTGAHLVEATLPREPILRVLRLADRVMTLPNDFHPDEWAQAFTAAGEITHRTDVTAYLGQKRAAMEAHVSQAGGERPRTLGTILSLPRPVYRLAFRHEYFVDTRSGPPARVRERRRDILDVVEGAR